MSCALAFERRRARNFKLSVQVAWWSVQQPDQRHSAWGNVSLLSGVRPGLETPCPAEEQRPSCVVHMDSADSRIFAAGALEHVHLPAVDGDVLLQAREATVHSERRYPNSFTGNQLPSSSASVPRRPTLRSKTHAANDTVELYCAWCETLPLTATALSHGNPTEHIFNFSYHDFLLVWSKVIERRQGWETLSNHWCHSGQGTADRPSTPPWARKEIKDRGRWKSDRSQLRYEQRARLHKSFHRLPAAYQAYALKCENVYSHQQCSNASRSVNQFLPRRPRGACFVVLSSGACKVGRGIRQRGFLVGWYNLNVQSTDLRRRRSDVRTGRVLGAVLCPSCASWLHCRASHADQRCSNVWGQKPCSSQFRLATDI